MLTPLEEAMNALEYVQFEADDARAEVKAIIANLARQIEERDAQCEALAGELGRLRWKLASRDTQIKGLRKALDTFKAKRERRR